MDRRRPAGTGSVFSVLGTAAVAVGVFEVVLLKRMPGFSIK
jgi:hypothetical protein